MNRDRERREQRRVLVNCSALFVGVVLGMWWTLARAGICDTDPNLCVATPTGPALVINICGSAASSGVCTTEQGAYQAGSDDPLSIGKSVGNVKVGPVGSQLTTLPVDASTPLPTPPGWSGPSSPPSSAGAPVTTYNIIGVSPPRADPMQACVDWYSLNTHISGITPGNTNGNTCQGWTATCTDGTCGGAGATVSLNTGTLFVAQTCPAGYSNNSGTCTLSDASQVVKPTDNNCGITRVGNTFAFDSRDTDCTGAKATAGGVSASGDTAQAGTERQNVKVKANSDGTTDVTVGTVNSRGNTDVVQAKIDGTGKVVGNARYTEIGSGALAGTSGSPQGGDCADCAKESTLSGFRNDAINGAGVKVNEQGSSWQTQRDGAAVKQQATLDALDGRKTAYDSAKSSGNAANMGVEGLTQFTAPTSHEMGLLDSLFPAPAACAPLVFTGGSGPRSYAMTLDVCPTVNFIRPLLDWFMAGTTIMYIYFAFWRRRQAQQGEG